MNDLGRHPLKAAVPEAARTSESLSSHKPTVSSHSSPATSRSASDPTGGCSLQIPPPAWGERWRAPPLAPSFLLRLRRLALFTLAPSPSRKLWPLPQSTVSWPTSFSGHGFLSPQAPGDKRDLKSPAAGRSRTRPHFPLLLPACLASALASPLQQPSLWGQPPQAMYGSPTSLLPLYLQTSLSSRLGQRRRKLGSSAEHGHPDSSRVSKPPSIPPISPTCHLRLFQPAWVEMLPLPHLAGSIWLQPELLSFLKPPDG